MEAVYIYDAVKLYALATHEIIGGFLIEMKTKISRVITFGTRSFNKIPF